MKLPAPRPVIVSCLAAIVLAVLATCTVSCTTTARPLGRGCIESHLVGTYYNPQYMSLTVLEGEPPTVSYNNGHFTVIGTSCEEAVRQIIEYIINNIPEDRWGDLDVGEFYDRPVK